MASPSSSSFSSSTSSLDFFGTGGGLGAFKIADFFLGFSSSLGFPGACIINSASSAWRSFFFCTRKNIPVFGKYVLSPQDSIQGHGKWQHTHTDLWFSLSRLCCIDPMFLLSFGRIWRCLLGGDLQSLHILFLETTCAFGVFLWLTVFGCYCCWPRAALLGFSGAVPPGWWWWWWLWFCGRNRSVISTWRHDSGPRWWRCLAWGDTLTAEKVPQHIRIRQKACSKLALTWINILGWSTTGVGW